MSQIPYNFLIVHLVLFVAEAKLELPSRLQTGRQRWARERSRLAYAPSVMRRRARSASARWSKLEPLPERVRLLRTRLAFPQV